MHSMLTKHFGCWLVLLATIAAGCAPAKYPQRKSAVVTGTVTYNGEPLSMGTVIFQPASGAFSSAEIESDGTYTLEAVIGPNQVQIISRDPEDETPASELTGPREAPKSHIPEFYGGPQSPLKFDVEAGDNTADFQLTDAGS